MNPYSSWLGARDPLEVIRATPARLEKPVQGSSPEMLNRSPAPGKWSVRDTLCHLADSEVVFAFRLRQALAEDHHVIQPFDQDRWAATYAHCEASAALAVFSAVRLWNLALIANLRSPDLAKMLNHPERGD